MENFDIGIIGAGPAGYTAALHAASLGKKIVLFEKDEIGGVCLNKGCIPTKSILKSSEVYKNIMNSSSFGIDVGSTDLNYSAVTERKNKIVEKLRKGIELALKNAKITVVKEEVSIDSAHKVISKSGEIYECGEIYCASGARPREIKGLEYDGEFILSSDDVLNLTELPKNVLIIGSGAIGIEWARIFSNFGVETTVVELASHLLPVADTEVSKRIERIFKTSKVKFYTETFIEKIEDKNVTLSNGEILTPEIILVAVGRVPNETEKIDGVKYIGDVSGGIQLAHYAIKQAIENIDGIKFDKNLVPSVVYGSPEIAWVGLREQDLENDVYEKHFKLISSLGKAWCDSETEGFIKILTKDGKIVGAHIVAPEASSLLQQILISMQHGVTTDKLKEVCFPHPTYSEGIFESLF